MTAKSTFTQRWEAGLDWLMERTLMFVLMPLLLLMVVGIVVLFVWWACLGFPIGNGHPPDNQIGYYTSRLVSNGKSTHREWTWHALPPGTKVEVRP